MTLLIFTVLHGSYSTSRVKIGVKEHDVTHIIPYALLAAPE